MGVRKAQDAPIATAIRNGSTDASMPRARLIATGAARTAAAALLTTLEISITATISSASVAAGGSEWSTDSRASAISCEPPLVSSAWPTGSMAATSTMTDISMLS